MRTPEKNKESTATKIKIMHRKEGKGQSLKEFARVLMKEGGEGKQLAKDWLYNKGANTSSPPKGIGRTSGKGKKGGGKKES